ncbi:zinc-dependent metalloprotease family protein [Demequina subtropica]|uniref:zinc-dependent metalloprotease family protein n=1 Tax=Demequina subtropica TaxID=1638989 RepID=UPI00078237D4|nr:zinc-dependent metalloprotease family protein [Demequina subtropica]
MSVSRPGALRRALVLLAAWSALTVVAVSSAPPASAASSSVASPRAHRAYVVTISDPRVSGDVSAATATRVTRSAANYWTSESRGAITAFPVKSTRTMRISGSCGLTATQLWSRAAKRFPGVDFSKKANHLVVYSPTGCRYGYSGLANAGTLHSGGKVHMVYPRMNLVAHELGHNLGLMHSNLRTGKGSSTRTSEYYGLYGPMGIGMGTGYAPGALGAAQRAYLGLPGEARATVSLDTSKAQTRTVTLSPTHTRGGTRAVRITDKRTKISYYLEYRNARGTDAGAYYASGLFGPLTVQYRSVVYRSGLLATQAKRRGGVEVLSTGRSGRWHTTHRTGQTFSSSGVPFTATVVSQTATTMKVRISVKRSV